MPIYNKKSKANLSTCHPLIQAVFNEVIKDFDCSVIEGLRAKEKQKELYEKGFTKTLKSKHLLQKDGWSHAVDVVPFPSRYSSIPTMCYFAGYVMGIAKGMGINLIWGGDFNRNKLIQDADSKEWFDGAHFELLITDKNITYQK